MKKASYNGIALATILVLSIATSYLGITLAANQNSTSAPSSIRVTHGNATLTTHKITASELQTLKTQQGTYNQTRNYNQIVGGHGTGLSPPTAETWQDIAQNGQVIESIAYQSPPASYDNSQTIWFPPIGNQDGQGSCTAWAVGYYVKTFQEAKEHNWDLSGATWEGGTYGHPSTSYQNKIMSPSFLYNLINYGVDDGSNFEEAIDLINNVGLCTWQKMPYTPNNDIIWPSTEAWTEATLYRGNSDYGSGYLYIDTDSDVADLKSWLAAGNLAVIAVDAGQYNRLTPSDVWTSDRYQTATLNHANTIVGYDDNITYTEDGVTHYGAFKVANSWGIGGWEETVDDGFYWISYNTMKELSTPGNPCVTFQDLTGYQPEILASFQINHEKRGECQITFGLGTPTSPIVTKSFSETVLGGSAPFCTNRIVFDLTEFKSYMTSYYNQPFYMSVRDGGTSTIGTITYFAIGNSNCTQTPKATVNGGYVNLALIYSSQPTVELTPISGPSNDAVTIDANNTDLSDTLFVHNGQSIIVDGGGFSPGSVSLLWDDLTDLGEATADFTGAFSATIEVPSTELGEHMLVVRYSDDFCVNLTVSPKISHDYSGTWHTEDFTIALSTDYPVENIHYKINGDIAHTVAANDQPLITTEGNNNTLEYWATWNQPGVGIIELPHMALTEIQLDKTAPTGTVSTMTTTTTKSITLTLALTDDVSGMAQMRFSNNGLTFSDWEPYATTKAWTLPEGDGQKTVTVQFMDNAGIVSTRTCTVTLHAAEQAATQSTATPNSAPTTTPKSTQTPATPTQTPPPSATPTASPSPYAVMPNINQSLNAMLPEIIVVLVAGVLVALVVVVKVKGISKK